VPFDFSKIRFRAGQGQASCNVTSLQLLVKWARCLGALCLFWWFRGFRIYWWCACESRRHPYSLVSCMGSSHAVLKDCFSKKSHQESLSRVLAQSFLSLQSPTLLGSQEPPESLALRSVLDCLGGPWDPLSPLACCIRTLHRANSCTFSGCTTVMYYCTEFM
jgi:hypothetical protein